MNAALGAAPDNDEGTGGGDGQDVLDTSDENSAGHSVPKKINARELGETSKPPTRPTKKKQENEDWTEVMISFMSQDEKEEKEQDEIDLVQLALG